MKSLVLIIIFVLVLACKPEASCHEQESDPVILVYFSPNGGAADAVVKEIDRAQKDIRIQAYSFTNPEIGQALLAAHGRGVVVEVILDGENLGNPHSLLKLLAHAGVECYLDRKHAIAHNKVMIIDWDTVISGSMNYTKAGDRENAENLLVIKDRGLEEQYLSNWRSHQAHSQKYVVDE